LEGGDGQLSEGGIVAAYSVDLAPCTQHHLPQFAGEGSAIELAGKVVR
jgi:hypothetical protein